mmetsp:Transcript_86169/g.241012  ORF Transcript_86169/g.241012 Transcript_86169/m.241012 type:complete len:206 (+) Transcript_86169:651-1268(+)
MVVALRPERRELGLPLLVAFCGGAADHCGQRTRQGLQRADDAGDRQTTEHAKPFWLTLRCSECHYEQVGWRFFARPRARRRAHHWYALLAPQLGRADKFHEILRGIRAVDHAPDRNARWRTAQLFASSFSEVPVHVVGVQPDHAHAARRRVAEQPRDGVEAEGVPLEQDPVELRRAQEDTWWEIHDLVVVRHDPLEVPAVRQAGW